MKQIACTLKGIEIVFLIKFNFMEFTVAAILILRLRKNNIDITFLIITQQ